MDVQSVERIIVVNVELENVYFLSVTRKNILLKNVAQAKEVILL